MDHIERFRAVAAFQPLDRLPMVEWAPWWTETLKRWYTEGLPAELTDRTGGEIEDYFGLDCHSVVWAKTAGPDTPKPQSYGSGIIQNMDDYLNLLPCLYPQQVAEHFSRKGMLEIVRSRAERHARGEIMLRMNLDGFFWFPRRLLGIERHFYAFYDQPELIHRINHDLLEFNMRVLDDVCAICTPTFLMLDEDMAYNHGPMLSKECFDEFLAPYYRRFVPMLRERGIVPMVDSDGDATGLVPWLEEVGIEGLAPFERRAGCDVAEIRRKHPRFLIMGAFDKTVMKDGETAMRREFERLLPVMRQGGFIPSVDHQTPPDVSLTNYKTYVSLLHEYCAAAANG